MSLRKNIHIIKLLKTEPKTLNAQQIKREGENERNKKKMKIIVRQYMCILQIITTYVFYISSLFLLR